MFLISVLIFGYFEGRYSYKLALIKRGVQDESCDAKNNNYLNFLSLHVPVNSNQFQTKVSKSALLLVSIHSDWILLYHRPQRYEHVRYRNKMIKYGNESFQYQSRGGVENDSSFVLNTQKYRLYYAYVVSYFCLFVQIIQNTTFSITGQTI